jgi:glycosyltransferase involved in cell wall biosynthesis
MNWLSRRFFPGPGQRHDSLSSPRTQDTRHVWSNDCDLRTGSPEISLIVCTRSRAMPLRRCLNTIAGLEMYPHCWELVVVNNGSTDETDFVVRDYAASMPFRVTLVDEPKHGVSRARNAGVRVASAPLIAFTDDDCYVASSDLRCLLEAFRDPALGYLGGRILLHDPTDAAETILVADDPFDIPADEVLLPGQIHGANMAFRREVWERIGGFDPLFGPGAHFVCDDIDFLCRASLAGYRGAYRPAPVIWHHHGRKPGPAVARLHRTYARGRGAYYAKGCLHSPRRHTFAKHWYWHLRTQARSRRYTEIARELLAGLHYAAMR